MPIGQGQESPSRLRRRRAGALSVAEWTEDVTESTIAQTGRFPCQQSDRACYRGSDLLRLQAICEDCKEVPSHPPGRVSCLLPCVPVTSPVVPCPDCCPNFHVLPGLFRISC